MQLFSGQAAGFTVRLPGWQYPVVCDVSTGHLNYDNYEGYWGNRKNSTCSCRPMQSRKLASRRSRQGHSVIEQQLADGSIKLTIRVAGGAQ